MSTQPKNIDPFKSIFSFGEKWQNRSYAILGDLLRFFAICFSEIKLDTGKRLNGQDLLPSMVSLLSTVERSK